jgi:hypothetical protein
LTDIPFLAGQRVGFDPEMFPVATGQRKLDDALAAIKAQDRT